MKKLGKLRKKPSSAEAMPHAFLSLAALRFTTAKKPVQSHQMEPQLQQFSHRRGVSLDVPSEARLLPLGPNSALTHPFVRAWSGRFSFWSPP